MRLNLNLPKVEPNEFEFPKQCPREGCPGMRFMPRQEVRKKLVDAQHPEVTAWRCECKQFGHVIRVYPQGVSQKQISKRVNGMAVMLYLLGLSYGAVEIVLNSLGMGIGKTSVYRAVQSVAEQVPGLKREKLLSGYKTKAIGVPAEQALGDLASLREMIHSRRPEDQSRLEEIYLRYANAGKPGRGHKHDVAYRMRNLFMDRWNLWPRLTFYRNWKDEDGKEILDGSNNHCERAIGWWIKERYRSMRGYKQSQSAFGVSRLIAFAGNHLAGGLRLADLMA